MSAQSMATASDIREGDRRRWLILSVLVLAQFMVVLDVAIVNVALPTIKNDLHFSEDGLQWVITAYAIVFGGVLLLGGRMADLLGRRRIFMVGMAVFTIFSLLDGLAWSSSSLIAFRGLQGLGAALLAPAALSILTTTFREGRDRNVALGIWGAASRKRGRRRRPTRWRPDQRTQLVLDLLHQRPRRHPRARDQPGAPEGEPRRPRPPPLRHGRRRLDHGRPDAARLRAHAREPARLGHGRDDRASWPRRPLSSSRSS